MPSFDDALIQTEGDLLPEGFKDLQVWRDLSDAIDEVLDKEIGSMVNALLGIRDIKSVVQNESTDRPLLLRFNAFLGYNQRRSDILTDSDLKRFAQYLPLFYNEKGNRNFIDFMSFAVNALLELSYLWTEDYETFFPEGSSNIGTPIWEGGTWYPTSQVYIEYDVEKFIGSVSDNFNSQETLTKFFYIIAPIHLVINQFVLTINSDPATLYVSCAGQMRIWESTYDESLT